MQVDAVLARLGMLKERIDATEACIALDLDHRRNELVAFNLVSLLHVLPATRSCSAVHCHRRQALM